MQEPSDPDRSPGCASLSLPSCIFRDLCGTWLLDRQLQSADPSAPSGRCSGTATFTPRTPSPVLDDTGTLHLAVEELLYREQGEFELTNAPGSLGEVAKFPFARTYIWRLNRTEHGHHISIWFTKPGTDTIHYLFHHIDLPFRADGPPTAGRELILHGTGGHLCVDDFYSSSYSFVVSLEAPRLPTLSSWTALHEVRGPKKDQVIETTFSKSPTPSASLPA